MKRFIKSAVGFSAVFAFSLLCIVNPADAQDPEKPLLSRKRLESIKDRAVTPASGGLSSRRTAEKFAVLLPSRIVNFAEAVKGKKVDAAGRTFEGNADVDAQCTYLVIAALAAAGAKPGDFTDQKNYVWGKLQRRKMGRVGVSGALFVIAHGDIIQFEGCRFEKKDANGRVVQWFDMLHHTAIVKSATGTSVVLLHQNAPEGGPVNEVTLDLAWKTSGTYKVYTPVPK